MPNKDLKYILDNAYKKYHRLDFITLDPISIPHRFSKKQDIEIAGLFAAIFAWGQRKTILNKCNELLALMHFEPFDFILNHTEKDLKPLESFKHRTFNSSDLSYFIWFLNNHYRNFNSLEVLFEPKSSEETNTETSLNNFREVFANTPYYLPRNGKHISSPKQGSACKRLNMYLRWMVRSDEIGLDFGLWKKIKPNQLVMPIDLHVKRVSEKIGLYQFKQVNWQAAVELTELLKEYDSSDPVKYDYALFGMGIDEKYGFI